MAKKPKLRVVGPVDTEKLEGFIKRIEAVESEEDDYKAAKKDLYVEVKAAGLKPKLVRKIVKERKPKAVDEAEQAELETYREALGMASFAVRLGHLSLREAERAFGVSKSSIHRHLSVPEVSHDPDTGEITETADRSPPGGTSERAEINAASGAGSANNSDVPPAGGAASAVEMGHGTPDAGIGSATHSCCWGDGEAHSSWCPNGPETGSATVVATGNLDALSPDSTNAGRSTPAASGEVFTCPTSGSTSYNTGGLGAIAEGDSPQRVADPVCAEIAPVVWHQITATREAFEAERKAAREAERERRRAVHAAWVAKNAEIDADPLTPPVSLMEKRREIEARKVRA